MISGLQHDPGRASTGGGPTGESARRRRGALATAGIMAGYVVAAWLLLWPLPLASNARMPGCACVDPAQQVWYLALAHHEVASAHLSFFTRLASYPTGANLLVNTSMPLVGWLASPLTGALGPVASYDLLCRLALLASAAGAFALLRGVGIGRLGAGLGGLLYGFSPYMVDQGGMHLFLMWVPLPPLLLLLVYRQLQQGGKWPTVRRGVALGLLAVAQFLICSEILVTTGFMTVGVLLLLGATLYRHRREEVRRAAGRMAALGAVAVGVAGAPLGWAAHFAFAGPQAITGPTKRQSVGVRWDNVALPVDRSELLGHLVPWYARGVGWFGDVALLGLPLLVVGAATVVAERRDLVVVAAGLAVALAWVLSLGPAWAYRGAHQSPVGFLPWRVFAHLPVLQDVMPNRLTLYEYLGMAVLVGVAVDRLVGRRSPWPRPLPWSRSRSSPAGIRVAGVAAVAASIAVLAPWPPALPSRPTGAARLAGTVLDRAAPGTTALTYPYPTYEGDQAMLWQSFGGLRHPLLGGYLLRPDAEGQVETAAPPLHPDAVPRLLEQAWLGQRVGIYLRRRAYRQLPRLVRRYHVGIVVVDTATVFDGSRTVIPGRRCRPVVRLFTRAYGPPARVGPLDVWRLPILASPDRVARIGPF